DGFEVAIQLLHPHLVVRPGTRERFRREAWLASHVSPAYVARVFEFGATPEGTEYIVMERLRGADLALVLERRGRLTLEEVVPMVERIAEALEAAHAVGIVHRDLKPENVFLAGDEDVRLLDFGVARHEAGAGLTLANEVLGTPGYMAPEQACGRPSDVGPHTDVFALGAIVYRCLTGRAAFPSRTACAAIYEAMHLVPEAPSSLVPELGPDIDIVVARALAKASERRYPRARAFAEELRRAATARRSGRRLIAFRGGVDAEDTKLERPNRETAA
ncbi:MAG TPA: serine/threonine-protein kinase, partial [Polyangiaceae bacterium]